MSFGVRIYSKLASHELNQIEETSRDLVNAAFEVTQILHGLYDTVESPLGNAPILENEAPIRGAEVDSSYLMYLDQTYRCYLYSSFSEVRDGN